MVKAPTPDSPTQVLAPAAAWVGSLLDALGQEGSAATDDSLGPAQRRGRDGLAAASFPSRRQEDWRFTDPAAITALAPRRLTGATAPTTTLPAPDGVLRLWLGAGADPLDGVQLPAGLERLQGPDLEHALGQSLAVNGCREHWPVLLNKAVSQRVLALRVSGAVAPVLELVSDAAAAEGVQAMRVLLLLEPGASLELLQVHRSSGANLTSVVVEAQLAAKARLRHGVLALATGATAAGDTTAAVPVLLAHLAVVQEPGSTYALTSATGDWGLARLEPRITQSGGGATTRLRGLQVVRGRQIADTHGQVLFDGPDGTLDQLHKAVADDAGRSVFNGAVRVPASAQRTDAAQLSRNLLLSDRARIDTKPELEIVADDVRCAHGATVSRLQQDELFYLQSRGIAADRAARLLLRGFCQEVLAELPPQSSGWQPLTQLLGEDPSGR